MSSSPAVRLRELSKRFDTVDAVSDMSLTIEEGETFGLLGPNGAGKTTLLGMLATLLPPSAGDAEIFGHSLTRDVAAVRRAIGLAPQDVSLYPDLSGEENLAFFGRLYGLSGSRLREEVDRLLALVGLAPRRGAIVRTYSGGMRRRLNFACSLVHRPRLVLLDEPTVGVDPQSRENIFAAVDAIAAAGTTVLYTTHYMEEAERLCDRIAIVDEGRLVALGDLRELLALVGGGEVVELRGVGAPLEARLRAMPDVRAVEAHGDTLRVVVPSAARALEALARVVAEGGSEVSGIEIYPVTLERVFMSLTGKALRD